MSLIAKLTPVNLQQEKEKFFNDSTYNPQFEYQETIPTNKLTFYGKPQTEVISKAKWVVEQTFAKHTEEELRSLRGPEAGAQEVERVIKTFLKTHQLEDRFQIVWSSSYVARTTITTDTIKLRLPADFRQEGLIGMTYHEIGTHALRRINYEQQPWFKQKNKFGFGLYLPTEEGLASMHGLIPQTFKLAYSSALKLLAVAEAQQGSFVDVWNLLSPYIQDKERRWLATFRQKRGLTDTSKPGGYSKDLAYFSGKIAVWRWLSQNNYDPTPLYFGKLGLEDVPKALQLNPDFTPKMPNFFTNDPNLYRERIEEIGHINRFA